MRKLTSLSLSEVKVKEDGRSQQSGAETQMKAQSKFPSPIIENVEHTPVAIKEQSSEIAPSENMQINNFTTFQNMD